MWNNFGFVWFSILWNENHIHYRIGKRTALFSNAFFCVKFVWFCIVINSGNTCTDHTLNWILIVVLTTDLVVYDLAVWCCNDQKVKPKKLPVIKLRNSKNFYPTQTKQIQSTLKSFSLNSFFISICGFNRNSLWYKFSCIEPVGFSYQMAIEHLKCM